MAIIKFGLAVSDIRGSVAGTTFSSGTYGAYARRKAVPTNTNTTAQGDRRSTFAGLSASWRGLTDAQRETWITQAPAYTRVNAFGDNVPLTGQALYMRCNLYLIAIGVTPIVEAIPPVSVDAPVLTGNDFDLTAGTLEFLGVGAVPANTAYLFKASNVISAGKKYTSKSSLRIMHVLPPATPAADLDIASDWKAIFGSSMPLSLAGCSVKLQVLAVSTLTGQQVATAIGNATAHV